MNYRLFNWESIISVAIDRYLEEPPHLIKSFPRIPFSHYGYYPLVNKHIYGKSLCSTETSTINSDFPQICLFTGEFSMVFQGASPPRHPQSSTATLHLAPAPQDADGLLVRRHGAGEDGAGGVGQTAPGVGLTKTNGRGIRHD